MAIRALQLDRPGGLDALTLRDVGPPIAKPGQVLVRTVASTINPLDVKMRAKPEPAYPITLGCDVAGIVVESDAQKYRPGDRVIAASGLQDDWVGAWTDVLALDPDQLAHAPERVSLSDSATIPLAGLTALQAWSTFALSSGARVLVTGAAGGIGGFIVQLAVNAGMEVDGLVSRPGHVDAVTALGARLVTNDPTALPTHAYAGIADPIATPVKGIDVREFLVEGGQYTAVGRDESKIPGGREVSVTDDAVGLSHLAKLVDDGALRLRVAARYGLQDFYAAHERFQAGGLLGKVVLDL